MIFSYIFGISKLCGIFVYPTRGVLMIFVGMSAFASDAAPTEPSPALKLLVRGRNILNLVDFNGKDASINENLLQTVIPDTAGLEKFKTTDIGLNPVYSKNGEMLAIVSGGTESNIAIFNVKESKKTCQITLPEIGCDPQFSPNGTYLITWSHYRKNITVKSTKATPTASTEEDMAQGDELAAALEATATITTTTTAKATSTPSATTISTGKDTQTSNLRVWRVSDGKLIATFFAKSYRPDILQFSSDERFLFHLVTGEIQIIDMHKLLHAGIEAGSKNYATRLIHKGLTQYQISNTIETNKGTSYINIAVFVPEISGKVAMATIYRFSFPNAISSIISYVEPVKRGGRSLFAASEAKMMWNTPISDTVLIHTHCGKLLSSFSPFYPY